MELFPSTLSFFLFFVSSSLCLESIYLLLSCFLVIVLSISDSLIPSSRQPASSDHISMLYGCMMEEMPSNSSLPSVLTSTIELPFREARLAGYHLIFGFVHHLSVAEQFLTLPNFLINLLNRRSETDLVCLNFLFAFFLYVCILYPLVGTSRSPRTICFCCLSLLLKYTRLSLILIGLLGATIPNSRGIAFTLAGEDFCNLRTRSRYKSRAIL